MAMKKAFATSLLILSAAAFGTPALAGQTRAAEIIFGKAYDDNVIAIQSGSLTSRKDGFSEWSGSGNDFIMRRAQAEVSADGSLMRSLEARGIAIHNVLSVETAANGGKVVYYR
jgi:hypothetical protein